jgi:hypothetical protein
VSTTQGVYAGYFDGDVHATGTITFDSDIRLKKDVRDLGYGIGEVMRLHPVTWRWKSRADNRLNLGLIAQEVDPILPELVEKHEEGTMGINYVGLVPVLIKAMQEQQETITALEAEVSTLKQLMQQLLQQRD